MFTPHIISAIQNDDIYMIVPENNVQTVKELGLVKAVILLLEHMQLSQTS